MGTTADNDSLAIARRWVARKGTDWSVEDQAGRGGTAPVFAVRGPDGEYALKIADLEFSSGERGVIEERRIEKQKSLGIHECPYLVKVYDGGRFEDRLFLLMNKAPGKELEKCLKEVPRDAIPKILDQIARACIFLRDRGLCHRDVKAANIYISSDFSHATLLDISVVRDIFDPLGLGTDHDGQLPVVATARYSPPEYLFRLLEAGSELWHAVDIYQLGGLLHDLIMREPLFEAEYSVSKDNRYRFAWVVATNVPNVEAVDVDQDLIFVARRALDKDWRRRSKLRLENFLLDHAVRRARALEILGLSRSSLEEDAAQGKPDRRARIRELARNIEELILNRLRALGLTPEHQVLPGNSDFEKRLRFTWTTEREGSSSLDVELVLGVSCSPNSESLAFESFAEMETSIAGVRRRAQVALPGISDRREIAEALAEQVMAVLGSLGAELLATS